MCVVLNWFASLICWPVNLISMSKEPGGCGVRPEGWGPGAETGESSWWCDVVMTPDDKSIFYNNMNDWLIVWPHRITRRWSGRWRRSRERGRIWKKLWGECWRASMTQRGTRQTFEDVLHHLHSWSAHLCVDLLALCVWNAHNHTHDLRLVVCVCERTRLNLYAGSCVFALRGVSLLPLCWSHQDVMLNGPDHLFYGNIP